MGTRVDNMTNTQKETQKDKLNVAADVDARLRGVLDKR